MSEELIRPNTGGCAICRPLADHGVLPLLLPVFNGSGAWPWERAEAEAEAGQVPAGWTLSEVMVSCECRQRGKAARILRDWNQPARRQLVAVLAWVQVERVRESRPAMAEPLAVVLAAQQDRTAKIAGRLRSDFDARGTYHDGF